MQAAAVGQSSPPLAIVVLYELVRFGVSGGEAEPVEGACAVFFVIEEMADVEVAIGVYLDCCAAFLVVVELAFVKFSISLQVHSLALSAFPIHLSEVYFIIAFDEFELGTVE